MSTSQKKAVCLYFQVHQPFRLRRYRFFEMGHEHYYYDDFMNESILRKIASNCYLPANRILLELIRKHKGKFRVTFSLTGIVIDQFRLYAPEVLASFRELAETGCVEFLAETNSHSLASLMSRERYELQVKVHTEKMKEYIGYEPTSIRNTELIYSDEIGSWMAELGYKAVVTEGAKHILGWKSPNYLYCNAINPRLKVLLRNYTLSDDIAFRFSDRSWASYPLTADKYASWLKGLAPASELVNIFMDYETFGEHQKKETGIFEFLKNLPDMIIKKTPFSFMTVSEVADHYQPVSLLHVPSPISWADEERDLTAWMGNELQTAAVNKLYSMSDRVGRCDNEQLMRDWVYLQSSDHFYYMSTKFFSDGAVHAYFNPYENPYQAFMNYMNVLSDFEIRLKSVCPVTDHDEEVNRLSADIQRRDRMIAELQEKLARLERKPAARKRAGVAAAAAAKKPAAVSTKVAAAKKAVAPKTAAKKAVEPKTAAKKPAPAPKGVAAKKPAAVSTKAATPVKATKAKKKVEADVKKPAATRAGSVRKKAGGK
ncbi:MAG: alpha-amylase [Bacteroidetes bacterium]|nr:MAG: alpha-amylase [Bacteroidota bacterium]